MVTHSDDVIPTHPTTKTTAAPMSRHCCHRLLAAPAAALLHISLLLLATPASPAAANASQRPRQLLQRYTGCDNRHLLPASLTNRSCWGFTACSRVLLLLLKLLLLLLLAGLYEICCFAHVYVPLLLLVDSGTAAAAC